MSIKFKNAHHGLQIKQSKFLLLPYITEYFQNLFYLINGH